MGASLHLILSEINPTISESACETCTCTCSDDPVFEVGVGY